MIDEDDSFDSPQILTQAIVAVAKAWVGVGGRDTLRPSGCCQGLGEGLNL